MRAKSVIPTFDEMVSIAPKEIQDLIEQGCSIKQSPKWHPEGDVCEHTKIVFNRARISNNINFLVAALFHDLGKIKVTKPSVKTPGSWSAHGHEYVSTKLVETYKNWIEEQGANFELVYYLVKNHMRIQQFPQMKKIKQNRFKEDKYFKELQYFTTFDDMLSKDFDDVNNK